MEENFNNNEEKQQNYVIDKHKPMNHFILGILVFLGAFAAFYVVSDWHFKKMYDPIYQIQKIDRMMMNQQQNMEKAFKKQMRHDFPLEKRGQIAHLERTPDTYKIIIDLKPFDNDEKNVEVRTDGNVLTINAAGIKDNNRGESIYKFVQNYTFDNDVKLNKMTKTKEGNALIIILPIED